MKNKFLAALILIPFISNAHPGHTHNATEIVFDPSQWLNHPVFILGIAIVFIILVRNSMKLYFPATYKMIVKKIKSNN